VFYITVPFNFVNFIPLILGWTYFLKIYIPPHNSRRQKDDASAITDDSGTLVTSVTTLVASVTTLVAPEFVHLLSNNSRS